MEPTLMKRRMWRYVCLVLLSSILLNIPKFFEAYVIKNEDGNFIIRISSMRKNTLYSAITKWTRLFLLGLIPFGVIVYSNFKIYFKLHRRSIQRISTIAYGKNINEFEKQVIF